MKCVRPFFNAHGMTQQTSTATSNETKPDTKTSTDSSTAVADIFKAARDELAVAYASAAAADHEDDENESSSMVVLARDKSCRRAYNGINIFLSTPLPIR